ncbi:hypothetical protein [Nitratifractor sp.]
MHRHKTLSTVIFTLYSNFGFKPKLCSRKCARCVAHAADDRYRWRAG